MKEDVFTLYGLDKCDHAIEKIVEDLECYKYHFDLKLILTEAITNVFKYGNNKNEDKPIYLSYKYKKNTKYIKMEIKSQDNNLEDVTIIDEITDDMLDDTSGRGLFLIKCMSDTFYFKEDVIVIEKCLN